MSKLEASFSTKKLQQCNKKLLYSEVIGKKTVSSISSNFIEAFKRTKQKPEYIICNSFDMNKITTINKKESYVSKLQNNTFNSNIETEITYKHLSIQDILDNNNLFKFKYKHKQLISNNHKPKKYKQIIKTVIPAWLTRLIREYIPSTYAFDKVMYPFHFIDDEIYGCLICKVNTKFWKRKKCKLTMYKCENICGEWMFKTVCSAICAEKGNKYMIENNVK